VAELIGPADGHASERIAEHLLGAPRAACRPALAER
jgi:hypothetical protein